MSKRIIPADALLCNEGQYYKFGLRNKIYVFGSDGWFRSAVTRKELCSFWQDAFMQGIKFPNKMPKNKEIRKLKEKELIVEHRAKMHPYIRDNDWVIISPQTALEEIT